VGTNHEAPRYVGFSIPLLIHRRQELQNNSERDQLLGHTEKNGEKDQISLIPADSHICLTEAAPIFWPIVFRGNLYQVEGGAYQPLPSSHRLTSGISASQNGFLTQDLSPVADAKQSWNACYLIQMFANVSENHFLQLAFRIRKKKNDSIQISFNPLFFGPTL
jgi:hypothetical protein